MRQFAICAILALCLGSSVARYGPIEIEPRALEGTINSTIEGIRPDIPEPFAIEDVPLEFPDEEGAVLLGNADLSSIEVTGLSAFHVSALNFALIGTTLNFTVGFPSINVNLDYTGDLALLHLIPLYGAGKLNIHIEGLEIEGSTQADISDGIAVHNLRVQIYLTASTFDIHGALNSEDFSAIASELLNDIFTSFVDNHQHLISDFLSPILETIINTVLAGLDTSETETPAP